MATCDLPTTALGATTTGLGPTTMHALHQLKELLQSDISFASALRSTNTTEEAAHLAAERGIAVTPESLWRQRGTLMFGGMPTWRG